MSPSASTSMTQISSYIDSHTVYPVVWKNTKATSWQDHLRSVILKHSIILNATVALHVIVSSNSWIWPSRWSSLATFIQLKHKEFLRAQISNIDMLGTSKCTWIWWILLLKGVGAGLTVAHMIDVHHEQLFPYSTNHWKANTIERSDSATHMIILVWGPLPYKLTIV